MAVYKRKDAWGEVWRYRKVVQMPDGTKQRIAGTPAINTKRAAKQAEQAHVDRLLVRPACCECDDTPHAPYCPARCA